MQIKQIEMDSKQVSQTDKNEEKFESPVKKEETSAKKRARISRLKQMQRRLDAKLSMPKQMNSIVHKPMES